MMYVLITTIDNVLWYFSHRSSRMMYSHVSVKFCFRCHIMTWLVCPHPQIHALPSASDTFFRERRVLNPTRRMFSHLSFSLWMSICTKIELRVHAGVLKALFSAPCFHNECQNTVNDSCCLFQCFLLFWGAKGDVLTHELLLSSNDFEYLLWLQIKHVKLCVVCCSYQIQVTRTVLDGVEFTQCWWVRQVWTERVRSPPLWKTYFGQVVTLPAPASANSAQKPCPQVWLAWQPFWKLHIFMSKKEKHLQTLASAVEFQFPLWCFNRLWFNIWEKHSSSCPKFGLLHDNGLLNIVFNIGLLRLKLLEWPVTIKLRQNMKWITYS